MTDHQPPAVFQSSAVAVTPADRQLVPSLIVAAGDAAGWRYVEFFAANDNTRRASAVAVLAKVSGRAWL